MPSFAAPVRPIVSYSTSHNFNIAPPIPLRVTQSGTEISEFHAFIDRAQSIRRSLESLDKVRDNWNSYNAPAPSERAIDIAWRVMTQLGESFLTPTRVLPSAEGGVAFVFLGADKNRAVIENLNNGEDFLLLYDRQGHSSTLEWEGDIPKTALELLKAHLRGSKLAAAR